MSLPVAAARNIVVAIKTCWFSANFVSREITWKYEDFYADFNGTILKEKQCVKEKL